MSIVFKNLSKAEFMTFYEKHPNNFLQTEEMAQLKRYRGYDIYYYGIINDTEEVIYAAFMTKRIGKDGNIFDIDGLVEADVEVIKIFIEGIIQAITKMTAFRLTISPNEWYKSIESLKNIQMYEPTISKILIEKGFIHTSFEKEYNPNGNPNFVFIKELKELTPETVQSSYKKNALYSIDKAKKYGVVLKELTTKELTEFKKITLANSQRIGYTDKTLEYYENVSQLYGKNAKFIVAELNFPTYLNILEKQQSELASRIAQLDIQLVQTPNSKKRKNQRKETLGDQESLNKRIVQAKQLFEKENRNSIYIAASLFIITPYELVYLFSGTIEAYRNMEAPFLIQDEMIQYATNNEIPYFNFYGVSGVFDGSDKVLNFKESFNGKVFEKIGTFTYKP